MPTTKEVIRSLELTLANPRPLAGTAREKKIQLAVLFYCAKSVRTAGGAAFLIESQQLSEALILIRSLFNLVVDFLWVCTEPERVDRFYDSTAVALEGHLTRFGVMDSALSIETRQAAQTNREHFDRVVDVFRDRKGKVRAEWAPGTIRDRAAAIAKKDPELRWLLDTYDWLYKVCSDYEHSAPYLAFSYVGLTGNSLYVKPAPVLRQSDAEPYAQLVAYLVGLVLGHAVKLGVLKQHEMQPATPHA